MNKSETAKTCWMSLSIMILTTYIKVKLIRSELDETDPFF